jgi:hypothetical protein
MGAIGGMCSASCLSYTAHKPEPCALPQRMQGSENSPQACQNVRAWPTCPSPIGQACGANALPTPGPQASPSPRQRIPGPQGSTCPRVHMQRTQPFCYAQYMLTKRDGRKGPPAGNKAKCNCTNTPHSRATRRKAKPNQKPQTHTRGERQA